MTMETRILGRTGAPVSALGFGGAPAGLTNYLGTWSASSAEAGASVQRAIRRALERGVTYFDTAPGYGGGLSETYFGAALGGDRDRVFLATKTSRDAWVRGGPRRSLEASLRRLGTDRVDLLQLHGGWLTPDQVDGILEGGVLEEFEQLRAEGKVRFLGFTAEGPNGGVERLIATDRFDALMICLNLTYQGAGAYRNRDLPPETVLSLARARRMGAITMRTLTSGVLQRWLGQVAPHLLDGFDWGAALLGFVLSHPQVDVALVGMRTEAEVDRNVEAATDPRWRVDMAAVHDGYGG
jgi:aryl-alcohol dehydrogenase-like predicted oxidoreductase